MAFLQRALADLGEGIRCLLGSGTSRPDLVAELLEGRLGGSPPPGARPRGRAPARRRVAPQRHLVIVK